MLPSRRPFSSLLVSTFLAAAAAVMLLDAPLAAEAMPSRPLKRSIRTAVRRTVHLLQAKGRSRTEIRGAVQSASSTALRAPSPSAGSAG